MNFSGTLQDSINTVISIITTSIIPLLITLATVGFLWGMIKYITAADDENKLKEAKWFILYSLLGLFVMVSVWALVKILVGSFSLGDLGLPAGPRI